MKGIYLKVGGELCYRIVLPLIYFRMPEGVVLNSPNWSKVSEGSARGLNPRALARVRGFICKL